MDPQRLFGPITTRTLRIDQFDTFFLNNIPYAEVPPESVNWGAIEYDGPDALGIAGGKPALQWHFGGVPYPISRAVRINYTYVRKWDGTNATITTAIFLGFQANLNRYIRAQAIPFLTPTPTFLRRIADLGPYGGFSTHSWASDAGVLASEAQALITRSVVYDAINQATFDNLMQGELGPLVGQLQQAPVPVDFDGPAQDYDSHRPFEYTFATLQNEPEKYSQLLFWYFGGKVFRLTKAMRIPLDPANAGLSFVLAQADALQRLSDAQQREQELSQRLAPAGGREATPARQAQAELSGAQEELTQAQTALSDLSAGPRSAALFIGYSGPDPGPG